jgi:hypothetical protein
MMKPDQITSREYYYAETMRGFEELPEVWELKEQLHNGLITSEEFSHKILVELYQFREKNGLEHPMHYADSSDQRGPVIKTLDQILLVATSILLFLAFYLAGTRCSIP